MFKSGKLCASMKKSFIREKIFKKLEVCQIHGKFKFLDSQVTEAEPERRTNGRGGLHRKMLSSKNGVAG